VPDRPARGLPPFAIEFGSVEWEEEVERLDPHSPGRTQAERARKSIEAGAIEPAWKRCQAEGPGGTKLPGCLKLYVPLGKDAPSEAPHGFVFQLVANPDGSLAWNMIAFGERHPSDDRTRNVYERAHRRLHGRYPAS
jgi:hypothetical protein